MLDQRLKAEEGLLRAAFGLVELDIPGRLVILPARPLGCGWSVPETPVLVEVPQAYPTTPPDNLCVSAELRLENGSTPANSMGIRSIAGRDWLQFSYHIESSDWRPHADLGKSDTIVTYLLGALRRLEEPY
jgi:hypothetical protein